MENLQKLKDQTLFEKLEIESSLKSSLSASISNLLKPDFAKVLLDQLEQSENAVALQQRVDILENEKNKIKSDIFLLIKE